MKRLKILSDNIVLILILSLSFFANFYMSWRSGYSNEYYASAVKSMLMNFHNFFFASFDPGGFVTVDKPPLALWVQCLSAFVFGFNGVSILLPEALASVVSVGILYKIIKRNFGKMAGLLAAFVLATTPIFVAVSRTNNMDSILVMLIMIAAWYITVAAEKGNLKMLIISAVFVGLGFNAKMLEAYMVLPAFYITYLMSISINIKKKIMHIIVSKAVLLIVSLSWAVIVDLTPVENRPYIGSSSTNSVLELALGYNGIQRVLPSYRNIGHNNESGNQNGGRIGFNEGGPQSVLRLFNKQMAGQISWLLMIAIIGMLSSIRYIKNIESKEEKRYRLQNIILWSTWIAPMLVYFSISGFFHRYYLSILAPAIAAMVSIGIVTMWGLYKKNSWEKYLLPSAMALDGVLQGVMIFRYEEYRSWLIPISGGISIISAIVLVVIKNKKADKVKRYALITGVASLLVIPIIWTATPLIYGDSSMMPYAGPELKSSNDSIGRMRMFDNPAEGNENNGFSRQRRNDDNKGGMSSSPNSNRSSFKAGGRQQVSQELIDFLVKNNNGEKFIVAVSNASSAESIILSTGKPVMAMGGFSGSDNILTVDKFKRMVETGEVRYALINDMEASVYLQDYLKNGDESLTNNMQNNIIQGFGMKNAARMGTQSEITDWIKKNGVMVSQGQWSDYGSNDSNGSPFQIGAERLYDLKPKS